MHDSIRHNIIRILKLKRQLFVDTISLKIADYIHRNEVSALHETLRWSQSIRLESCTRAGIDIKLMKSKALKLIDWAPNTNVSSN